MVATQKNINTENIRAGGTGAGAEVVTMPEVSGGQKLTLRVGLQNALDKYYLTAEHRNTVRVFPRQLFERLSKERQAYFRKKAAEMKLPDTDGIEEKRKIYADQKIPETPRVIGDTFLGMSDFDQIACLMIYGNEEDAIHLMDENRIHSALVVGKICEKRIQDIRNDKTLDEFKRIRKEYAVVLDHMNGWNTIVLHTAKQSLSPEHQKIPVDDIYNHEDKAREVITAAKQGVETGSLPKKLSATHRNLPQDFMDDVRGSDIKSKDIDTSMKQVRKLKKGKKARVAAAGLFLLDMEEQEMNDLAEQYKDARFMMKQSRTRTQEVQKKQGTAVVPHPKKRTVRHSAMPELSRLDQKAGGGVGAGEREVDVKKSEEAFRKTMTEKIQKGEEDRQKKVMEANKARQQQISVGAKKGGGWIWKLLAINGAGAAAAGGVIAGATAAVVATT